MAKPSEFDLIAKYFAPLTEGNPSRTGDAFGLRDDAAVLSCTEDEDWVVTKDAIAEGIHFLPDDPPKTVAKKLLRVNLSDLAAKGAHPKHYLLAIALPDTTTAGWIADFADGLAEDQAQFGVRLLGGDTIATSGPMLFTLTAFGTVSKHKMIRRSGAQVGDHLFVSGTIGDAHLGLKLLKQEIHVSTGENAQALIEAYRVPTPKVDLIEALRQNATAALDVSDGLFADLDHLCKASGVGAQIDIDAVPLSGAARSLLAEGGLSKTALFSGGDDYQLLFTASASAPAVPGTTKIGEIIANPGLWKIGEKAAPELIEPSGFRHF